MAIQDCTYEGLKKLIGKEVIDNWGQTHVIKYVNNPLVFDYPLITEDGHIWSVDHLTVVE